MEKTVLLVGLPLVILALFFWGAQLQEDALAFFGDTNVACLPNGHNQIAMHIHPVLTVTVDGERELVPASIGIAGSCMSEMHTHDATGTLHVETATRERFEQIAFTDFFSVWGQPIEREGFSLTVEVDGTPVESVEDVVLRDGSQIELQYTSETQVSVEL